MNDERRTLQSPATAFPRSTTSGPNLVTLDQLRAVRRRRGLPVHALRRPVAGEKVAC
jgi:hypothetical protein